jgi:hypothetical protein
MAQNNDAEALAMTLMFRNIGFSDEAAQYIVNKQGIKSINTLKLLDEEHVINLCKVCRRPGGTVPGQGNRNAQPVANPGIDIPFMQEHNFKMVNYLVRFKVMTSRPIDIASLTVANAQRVRDLKTEIDGMENPKLDEAPTLDINKAFDFFDDLKDFLGGFVGNISRRPLSYVIRSDTMPKAHEADPEFGSPDSVYRTYLHEIEGRAPIKVATNNPITLQKDPHFILDNVTVWKILHHTLKSTSYLTHIKPFMKQQDGREAYLKLYEQLLGTQAMDNYATRAENRLASLSLDGHRKKNWGYDKYVLAHKEQHYILTKLEEHGHEGIKEASKIRHFLQGITDPSLATVKGSLACLNLKTFDEVCAAFKTYRNTAQVNNRPDKSSTFHVAALSSTTGNRRADDTKKISGPDDGYDPAKDYSKFKLRNRFFKTPEWNKLSKGQRNFLRSDKSYRKRKGGGEFSKEVAKLKSTISALKIKVDGSKDDPTSNTDEGSVTSSDSDRAPPRKKTKVKSRAGK